DQHRADPGQALRGDLAGGGVTGPGGLGGLAVLGGLRSAGGDGKRGDHASRKPDHAPNGKYATRAHVGPFLAGVGFRRRMSGTPAHVRWFSPSRPEPLPVRPRNTELWGTPLTRMTSLSASSTHATGGRCTATCCARSAGITSGRRTWYRKPCCAPGATPTAWTPSTPAPGCTRWRAT